MRYPPNNQLIQTNRGNLTGTLQGSFNIDLSTKIGAIRTTRMYLETQSSGTGPFQNSQMTGVPKVFKDLNGLLFTIAGSRIHSNYGLTAYTQLLADAFPNTPTDCTFDNSDLEVFNNRIWAVVNNKLLKLDYTLGWQQNTGFSESTQLGVTMMAYADRMYIAPVASAKVISMAINESVTTTGAYTLAIGNGYNVTCMAKSSNRMWIGTRASGSQPALIYEWDGASTLPTAAYPIEARAIYAIVVKDNIPWAMDDSGRLLRFNYGSFTEVTRLPTNDNILYPITTETTSQFIQKNGMISTDDGIQLLINNQPINTSLNPEEFLPSGVWEYTEQNGLYHKYPLSDTGMVGSVNDIGQNIVKEVGGLFLPRYYNIGMGFKYANRPLIAGVTLYNYQSLNGLTNAVVSSNPTNAIGNENKIRGGYIVTPKIYSNGITDNWNKVVARYKKLNTNEFIEIKYRTQENNPLYIDATWTSSLTFTTTTNLVSQVGQEVEFLSSFGGGLCRQIKKVDVVGSTYTVTIDIPLVNADNIYSGGGTSRARVQNWKSAQIIKNGQFSEVIIGDSSSWIEFKVYMEFYSPESELVNFDIINVPAQQLI